MEGFTRLNLASSDAEELSSGILGNDHSWNTAFANANMTHASGNTVIQRSVPLDSQFIHASVASSVHSFQGDLLSAGTASATYGHRSHTGASMKNDSSCFIGNADSLSQHRRNTNGDISFPVRTNFGILPRQQQQNMPHNMGTFQQSSFCNLAVPRDAVQFSGTNQHRDFLKDTANVQGRRNAMLDLNFSATGSSCHSVAMSQAAVVAGYDLSKVHPLGRQTEHHGSDQKNMVISNSDSSSYSGNYDRRSMVVQDRTAAEGGCFMPISDNHGVWGQHRSRGTASVANSLVGHYPPNYDPKAYNCLSLNNIQQRNLNDPSNFSRTPSGICIDSGNMGSGFAATPSFPLANQLRPDLYPLARLNQKPCSSAPTYHHIAQVATPSASPLYRGVQMAAPELNRQAMHMDWNLSDSSPVSASPGGLVFPDTTSWAGAGGESIRPYISTDKSDATVVPTHKRKTRPPSGMGDAFWGKTQQNANTVNYSPARFVPPSTDQFLISPHISQRSPYSAPGPAAVHMSMPAPKQEQFVPPQLPSVMSRPRTATRARHPSPSVRPPVMQQQVTEPSSSSRRRPIRPLHLSIPPKYPGPRGKHNSQPAPEPKRLEATKVIDFKMQQGESSHPLGYRCSICKRDVSYAPEGPITFPTAPLLPVAVLACGHTFHDQCLQAITPKGEEKDPPCIPCAIGED